MTEYEIRELCHEFFDAYQDRRVDVLDRLYSDDCIIWHNVFGKDTSRDDNIKAMPSSYDGQRRRTYNDRVINTYEDGFVIQYSLNGVMHNGHKGALWICIVGRVKDGKITRIDEYMDSGKFGAWAGIDQAKAKPNFGPKGEAATAAGTTAAGASASASDTTTQGETA
jgi:ketosteroid isomerase-like protein